MTYIVGLNLPIKSKSHEAGAALIDGEGNILFAASEERFSRVKLDGDFPEGSIAAMFASSGIKPEEVSVVAVPGLTFAGKAARMLEFLWRERRGRLFDPRVWLKLAGFARREAKGGGASQEEGGGRLKHHWADFIRERFPRARIVRVDHHLAHAAGAYYTSPWPDATIITLDGAGNLLSGLVARGREGRIIIADKTFVPHSAGTFWGSVTKVCGFRSGTRHGGKVTGLAARGDAKMLIGLLKPLISCDGLRLKMREDIFFDPSRLVPDWNSYEPERLKSHLGEATREDLAAAAQLRLIEVVTELAGNALRRGLPDKIVAAGGVFANVLLNEQILKLPGVSNIYVFPAMSDGGLSLGAALYALADMKIAEGSRLRPRALPHAYLGPEWSEAEMEEALKREGVPCVKMAEPAKEVARLVADKKVVALFQGRMEFGPRALGNRSITYSPSDPAVNDWLNRRLNRSEFMPFAPVTLYEKAKENYLSLSDEPLAAKYMTITYGCSEKMKAEAPACVHLDGTARPQLIKRADNPYYYDIISEYGKITGSPTVINTSFNMHEEPIVCSPEDAIRSFRASRLDCLVLGPFLARAEKQARE